MKTLFLALFLLCANAYAAEVWVSLTPGAVVGSNGVCPGSYGGYGTALKTAANGWGWKQDTNAPVHTVTDTNRSDTKIVWLTNFGTSGCGASPLTVDTDATGTKKHRFTVYFPNNLLTNQYWLKLDGFLP